MNTPSLPFEMAEEIGAGRNVNPRQKVIDAVLAKQQAAWREAFTKFVLDFAANATDDFTAENVRDAYDATPNMPRCDRQQGSGGIFQRLVKERKLKRQGMIRSHRFGNLLQGYSRY